jgi:hypothetical protein
VSPASPPLQNLDLRACSLSSSDEGRILLAMLQTPSLSGEAAEATIRVTLPPCFGEKLLLTMGSRELVALKDSFFRCRAPSAPEVIALRSRFFCFFRHRARAQFCWPARSLQWAGTPLRRLEIEGLSRSLQWAGNKREAATIQTSLQPVEIQSLSWEFKSLLGLELLRERAFRWLSSATERAMDTTVIDVELPLLSGSPFFRESGPASQIAIQLRRLSLEIAPLGRLRLILQNSVHDGTEVSAMLLWAAWQAQAPLLRVSFVLVSDGAAQSPYKRLSRLLFELRFSLNDRALFPSQTLFVLKQFLANQRPAATADGSWPDICAAAALLFMTGWLPQDCAPVEVQDCLRDGESFRRFVELPGGDGPLLADIARQRGEMARKFWRSLPSSAQTPGHAEIMLAQIGYNSLPKEVFAAYPHLLRQLVLRDHLRACPWNGTRDLLRLQLPREALVSFLRHAEEGLLQTMADAVVDALAGDSDQATWDRFAEVLEDDAALGNRCLKLLLRAARKQTRASSRIDTWDFPRNERVQTAFRAVFALSIVRGHPKTASTRAYEEARGRAWKLPACKGLRLSFGKQMKRKARGATKKLSIAGKQAKVASRQRSIRTCALVEGLADEPSHPLKGIEIGCALHLFSLADAIKILRAHMPRDENQKDWLSLLLVYGQMPAEMLDHVAQKAAKLLQQHRAPDWALICPRSCSDQEIIRALAGQANCLWARVTRSYAVGDVMPAGYAYEVRRGLFEVQAATQTALMRLEGEPSCKKVLCCGFTPKILWL